MKPTDQDLIATLLSLPEPALAELLAMIGGGPARPGHAGGPSGAGAPARPGRATGAGAPPAPGAGG